MKITLTEQEAVNTLRNVYINSLNLDPFGDLSIEIIEINTPKKTYKKKYKHYKDVLLKKNERLYIFLVSKGVIHNYLDNFIIQESSEDRIDRISRAFTWGESLEGHDFWYNIEKEYQELCD